MSFVDFCLFSFLGVGVALGGVTGKNLFSMCLNFGTYFLTDFYAVSSNMVLVFEVKVKISRSPDFDNFHFFKKNLRTIFLDSGGIVSKLIEIQN